MNKYILVGTHHKSGTVWMQKMFSVFAKFNGYEFKNINTEKINDLTKPHIFFSHESNFDYLKNSFDISEKGIQIVRDPRDLAISGAKYHSKKDVNEDWLFLQKNGMPSYYENLNSKKSFEEKVLFESENITIYTVKKMIKSKNKSNMLTIKYEDLFTDFENFNTLKRIAKHFNMTVKEFNLLKKAYTETHIFYVGNNDHVSSGEIKQYKSLNKETQEKLINFFKKEIYELEYEE
jgi:hypothetical protein